MSIQLLRPPVRNEAQVRPSQSRFFERLAFWATLWSGSSWAFAIALAIILVWLLTGPYFDYSDTWQLVINTGTTVITFLMVFLIQRSQNKESLAIQLKLNEIIAAVEGASNRLINVEDLSESEINALHQRFHQIVKMTEQEKTNTACHSVEEALEAILEQKKA